MQDFIKSSTDLTTSLQNPPTPKDDNSSDSSGSGPNNELAGNLQRPVINYIYLPTGNPAANALAVSNRQAYDARIP